MSAQRDHHHFIHVVGLYKCGTSWLLSILGAHPQVASWGEFDPLSAAYERPQTLLDLPRIARSYLNRAQNADWIERVEHAHARSSEKIFGEMFLGRGWIPVMGAAAQTQAASLNEQDCDRLLDSLLELAGKRVRRSDGPLLKSNNHPRTLGFVNFRRADLVNLMRDIQRAQPDQCASLFYDALHNQCEPGSRIACKGADQVMHFSMLNSASPNAQRVAIIRDGRDAAISAHHYETLMRKQEAPWRVRPTGASRRLLGWAVRAAKLEYHVQRGELAVVRYEDLIHDFRRTSSALFDFLKLEYDPALIDSIHRSTDFSAAADGRSRGESAEHIVRKGDTGEWTTALSAGQSSWAWRLAGRELERFGYSRTGEIRKSSLTL